MKIFEFNFQRNFHNISSQKSISEDRIRNLFAQKIQICGLSECTDPEVFKTADLLLHTCGSSNENCIIGGPYERKVYPELSEKSVEWRTDELFTADGKNFTVEFEVEIFSDLDNYEKIQNLYFQGMGKGESEFLNFGDWSPDTADIFPSRLENLGKFESILVLPTAGAI